VAFAAKDRAAVAAFYEAAIKAGGKDNGLPGLRPHYHKDYFGATLEQRIAMIESAGPAIPHSIAALLARQMTTNRRLPFVTTLHGTDITLVGADRSYEFNINLN